MINMDVKTISVIVGLVLTILTAGYKAKNYVDSKVETVITKIDEVKTTYTTKEDSDDAHDRINKRLTLQELRALHRKALADYYYWDDQCKATHRTSDCRRRDEAHKRVKSLEEQIEELEKAGGSYVD